MHPHLFPTRRTDERRRAAALLLSSVVVVSVLAISCTVDDEWRAGDSRNLPGANEVNALGAAESCDALADAARPALEQQLEWAWWPEDEQMLADGWTADADAGAGSDGSSAPATTGAPMPQTAARSAEESAAPAEEVVGTNNQEVGVEESDLVVTDGRIMAWVLDGTLRIATLGGGGEVVGRLDLGARQPIELLLRGDTVLVIGSTFGGWSDDVVRPMPVPLPAPMPTDELGVAAEPGVIDPRDPSAPATPEPPTTIGTTTSAMPIDPAPTTVDPATTTSSTTTSTSTTIAPAPIEPAPFDVSTTLTLVSIEEPASPRVLATADVEGSLVTSREIDGTARIVVRSTPDLSDIVRDAPDRTVAQARIEQMDGADLLPRRSDDGNVSTLGGCEAVFVAETAVRSPAGDDRAVAEELHQDDASLVTVTVLTVGDDLDDLAPVSIQGAADAVYASTEALYVAGHGWDRAGSRTDVHRFNLTADGPAVYTGSGRVPGRLLNQFSLSEHRGALRIVTTTDGAGSSAGGGDTLDGSTPDAGGVESMPVVEPWRTEARLSVLDTDGTLEEIGHVDGMGVGEEVQSVRFMGDLAYLVTFRQTDPLYAVDLSDPTQPTVLGELKITGFSEYLHPVGEGMLLGVGREADPETGIDEGFKVSLFDVSDPTDLVEVDRFVIAGEWSEVSADHKAFTWDPRRNQAIVPTTAAALVVRVQGSTLERVGELRHDGGTGFGTTIRRSRIVDGTIWSISETGLGATPADQPTSVRMLGG